MIARLTTFISLCLCFGSLPLSAAVCQTARREKPVLAAALLKAVEQQDRRSVKTLLAQGVSANVEDSRGRTPLMWAASRGDLALCQLLRQHKAILNRTDNDGETALSVVLSLGGSYGVRPDTPLPPRPDEATCVKLAQWLVENGANVNLSSRYGDPILVTAYFHLHDWTPVCKYLLLHGAVAQGHGWDGHSLLEYFATAADPSLLIMLLKRKWPQEDKDTALKRCLYKSWSGKEGLATYAECLRLLLAAGADPNQVSEAGYSLLTHAVFSADEEAVRLLIQHGANVNFKHKANGFTPFSIAKALENAAIEKLLRQAGAKETSGEEKK